jgi:hypothetical protein
MSPRKPLAEGLRPRGGRCVLCRLRLCIYQGCATALVLERGLGWPRRRADSLQLSDERLRFASVVAG